MASFVRIALAGAGSFAKMEIRAGDDISDLVERACAKFSHWGVNAGQISLYLVAAGGDDMPPPSAVDSARHLDQIGWSLTRAGISSGAWLVARKIVDGGASFSCLARVSPRTPHSSLSSAPPLAGASLSGGGGGGGGGAAGGARIASDFEALARNGGVGDFLASVAARAKTRFAQRVGNALTEQSPADAARVYWDAEQLPSTTTLHTFELDGFRVNGPLHEGSELTICYRGAISYVVKGVFATDALRLAELRGALAQAATAGARAPRHVAPFELRTSPAGRIYVVMPRYIDTFERMPPLNDAESIVMLWENVSAALSDLHGLGFAHGDVKPANLGVDAGGAYFLIDLDSAARFGLATQTTTEYLPVDERGVRVVASARADWWALAMTLAEKACGAAGLPLGHGARVFTASEVRAHLEAHLPAGVWAALAGHIAPR